MIHASFPQYQSQNLVPLKVCQNHIYYNGISYDIFISLISFVDMSNLDP